MRIEVGREDDRREERDQERICDKGEDMLSEGDDIWQGEMSRGRREKIKEL